MPQKINSMTVLKRDSQSVVNQVERYGSVLILKNNKPYFYAVSPEQYEKLINGASNEK